MIMASIAQSFAGHGMNYISMKILLTPVMIQWKWFEEAPLGVFSVNDYSIYLCLFEMSWGMKWNGSKPM